MKIKNTWPTTGTTHARGTSLLLLLLLLRGTGKPFLDLFKDGLVLIINQSFGDLRYRELASVLFREGFLDLPEDVHTTVNIGGGLLHSTTTVPTVG